MFVSGGQNFSLEHNNCPSAVPGCPPFVSSSGFFNDVWRSREWVLHDFLLFHIIGNRGRDFVTVQFSQGNPDFMK
jgi:hypothetical protein